MATLQIGSYEEVDGRVGVTSGNRLFGSAVSAVVQQAPPRKAHHNVIMKDRLPGEAGRSSQLRPGHMRPSIFTRMDQINRPQRALIQKQQWHPSKKGKNTISSSPVNLNQASDRITTINSEESVWKHDRFDGDQSAYPGSQVYVRNLPQTIQEQTLSRVFSKHGTVVSVKIDRGPLTTACIGFRNRESAQSCCPHIHGTSIDGYILKLAVVDQSQQPGAKPVAKLDIEEHLRPELHRSLVKSKPASSLLGDTPRISIFDRMS